GDKGRVKLLNQFARLFGEIAGQTERLGHRAAVMRHDAGGRIDREGNDFLGGGVGDFLDVHAAFGRDDEGDARGDAIDQGREIEFFLYVGAVLDIETVDLLARRAGLDGHQRIAKHLADKGLDLFNRFGEAHTALFA